MVQHSMLCWPYTTRTILHKIRTNIAASYLAHQQLFCYAYRNKHNYLFTLYTSENQSINKTHRKQANNIFFVTRPLLYPISRSCTFRCTIVFARKSSIHSFPKTILSASSISPLRIYFVSGIDFSLPLGYNVFIRDPRLVMEVILCPTISTSRT